MKNNRLPIVITLILGALLMKTAFLYAAVSLLFNGFIKCGVMCLIFSLIVGDYKMTFGNKDEEGDKDE